MDTGIKCLCLSGSYNASEAKDFAKGKDPFCYLSFIELCLWADSNLMIILQNFCFKNQAVEFKRSGICAGEGVIFPKLFSLSERRSLSGFLCTSLAFKLFSPLESLCGEKAEHESN